MAKQTVVWTRTADIHFAGVLQYWVEKNKSKSYSRSLIKLVSRCSELIAENPFLYTSSDFKNSRVSSLGHFSILYRTIDRRIIFTAFCDNRQDPNKLLDILKNKE